MIALLFAPPALAASGVAIEKALTKPDRPTPEEIEAGKKAMDFECWLPAHTETDPITNSPMEFAAGFIEDAAEFDD